jgi:hypothetical protein
MPNQPSCQGSVLHKCAPDGQSETTQDCGDPSLCDASGSGQCLTADGGSDGG